MTRTRGWALLMARHPRTIAAAAVVAISMLMAFQAKADQELDEMQRMIENDHAQAPSRMPLAMPAYLSAAWTSVCAQIASINDELRQQYSLVDETEAGAGSAWNSASQTVATVIDAWPFPHMYWAPGIVQDYTQALGVQMQQVLGSDASDTGDSSAPAPMSNDGSDDQ